MVQKGRQLFLSLSCRKSGNHMVEGKRGREVRMQSPSLGVDEHGKDFFIKGSRKSCEERYLVLAVSILVTLPSAAKWGW